MPRYQVEFVDGQGGGKFEAELVRLNFWAKDTQDAKDTFNNILKLFNERKAFIEVQAKLRRTTQRDDFKVRLPKPMLVIVTECPVCGCVEFHSIKYAGFIHVCFNHHTYFICDKCETCNHRIDCLTRG